MDLALTTLKRLFALSQNRCAFPGCTAPLIEDTGTVTGIICHIKARSERGPRYDPTQTEEERCAFDNLLLLCGRHSKLIDSEHHRYTVEVLRGMKAQQGGGGPVEISQDDARKAELLLKEYRSINISAGGPVMVNSPGGIQARSMVIKHQKKAVKILPPEGSLASDLAKFSYVKHLIKRYQEFAKDQAGRDFKYAVIYKAIERRYKTKWDLVPLHLFEDYVAFLQGKIDGTMLGRINRGKGSRNYSEYSEFRQQQGYAD
jgi:hypothetical protein